MFKVVVLNLGSIELLGFDGAVSGSAESTFEPFQAQPRASRKYLNVGN